MQDWNAATNSRWAYQKRNTHLLVVYRQDGMWNMHVIRGGIIIFQHGELHAHAKHKDRAQVLLWALATSVALSQLQSCNSTVPPKFYPTAHLLVHHTHAHRHFNNTNTEQLEGNTGLARLFRNVLVTNKCFSEELWHLEIYSTFWLHEIPLVVINKPIKSESFFYQIRCKYTSQLQHTLGTITIQAA